MKHLTPDAVTNSKHQLKKSPFPRRHTMPTVQVVEEITATKQDREIEYEKGDSLRRTIVVKQRNGSYGFHLESYRIYHKSTGETEIITFVSNVDYDGPAHIAGMRQGDVIVSVNGVTVVRLEHEKIVAEVRASQGNDLRLVVVFEDYVERIKLHKRLIKLKSQLRKKQAELSELEAQENALLKGHNGPVNMPSPCSLSNMSAIIDMNLTSFDKKWTPSEPTNIPEYTRSQHPPTSISLPVLRPTRDTSTGSFDTRTISVSSISTIISSSSSQEGIVFSAQKDRRNTTGNIDMPANNFSQPELKSPDSGYYDNNEHSANQRKSMSVNVDEEETCFSFPDDKAQLLTDDNELPTNEDDEDTSF